MIVNDDETLANLTAACDAYETALRDNRLDEMDALFWDSPLTLRYGVGENLHGIDEIRAFRKARPGGSPAREVVRRDIVTFGPDLGVCNLIFRRAGGSLGRQSQTWILTADGWKVVAAHVSLMADTH
ncbi:oxalurate catabolism protein HpxZ [Jiella sp. MQZ9-1]|uniref:Oxalurate catabolism protein HpxZ n=2 Tax=Jiella flava TaxID=2816857 RepID=A0A939JTR4_9HYPH|nr:oxalurate catabolism protein HpxZ [Jiella flava]MBO0664278.1 oxalurate catabolism protein HpxZ [Jiella flava]MCD2472799.1 oxalurate catabolism protein HpxZ [Jiella flava]